MKIIRQDGVVDNCTHIEISGKTIRYTPENDRRKKIICGTYQNIKRATEVFSEMTYVGWNNHNPEYTMPKE